MTKYRIIRTHWFRGGMFHWGIIRYNGGQLYTSYRIGPILIRRYHG